MIIFGLLLYRCIKRFPLLLVIIFSAYTFTSEIFAEDDNHQKKVEVNREYLVVLYELFQFKTNNTAYKLRHLVKEKTSILTTTLTQKKYLINCSLKHYC